MSLNTAHTVRPFIATDQSGMGERSGRAVGGDLSTSLFTTLNVAVFLVLAGCVAGAAILYGLGA